MNILIVEDNKLKLDAISRVIKDNCIDAVIDVADNYFDAIQCLTDSSAEVDLLLLDMSMSMHKKDLNEIDPKPNMFAGKDILSKLSFMDKQPKTIVITMYDDFFSADKVQSFDNLELDLIDEYGSFLCGMIKYKSNSTSWSEKLIDYLLGGQR